jgi:hypothetical protein
LVLLGENLAKALLVGKNAETGKTTLEDVAKQQMTMLTAIEQNQRQIMAQMESSNAVNAALLAFLQKAD